MSNEGISTSEPVGDEDATDTAFVLASPPPPPLPPAHPEDFEDGFHPVEGPHPEDFGPPPDDGHLMRYHKGKVSYDALPPMLYLAPQKGDLIEVNAEQSPMEGFIAGKVLEVEGQEFYFSKSVNGEKWQDANFAEWRYKKSVIHKAKPAQKKGVDKLKRATGRASS